MFQTALYYLLAFFIFIASLAGLQKWYKLPQPKKDKIGLEVLSIFFIAIVAFIALIVTNSSFLQNQDVVFIAMVFFFLFIVFLVIFLTWYNQKFRKKLNIGSIIIVFCLTCFAIVFVTLKYYGNNEKQQLINNIVLKTTVVDIVFDPHKPYFKDMILNDKQHLPMPESMNATVQIGDSIFKNQNEDFYTVVNKISKTRTIYKVQIHERVLGQPQ